MFSGCYTPMPKVKMKEYDPLLVSFNYNSSENKVSIKPSMFENILERLINLRTDNNICASTVNKHTLVK